MPPKLRRVSGEEAISVLKRLGFTPVRQRGSHVILKKQIAGSESGCVVPLHKELAIGTLRGILRQADVTPEEFMKNL
ncbi:type II toxin-antitoxin system HicA family toxin [Ktedonosporobacter rubrisoli]|uniref:Type II toxin-antitoxin system HicA family toxin n=1 Tax=Ktedonosporobacter rubrisoli TaxID=2509675 RepID=A0A4P6JYZ4_KTERU|nr:type II toxin-antitoxin system HicA family toxin [Ktedonosporobacter rubrisoli]